MRSSRLRKLRLNTNSAGVTPVVVWGVNLYANKNRLTLVCTLPGDRSSFFIPSLRIRTDLSTRPLDDGCLGDVFTQKIPFLIMKSRNYSLAKPVPLSEITMSGNPWVAKTCRSFSILAVALVLDAEYTSIHLLYASITIRNNCLKNDNVWSICRRDQAFSGHSQGCRGAAAGAAPCYGHNLHDLTLSSISVSSPGHHR